MSFVDENGSYETNFVEPIVIYVNSKSNISKFMEVWEEKLKPFKVWVYISSVPVKTGLLSKLNISHLSITEIEGLEEGLFDNSINSFSIRGNILIFLLAFSGKRSFLEGVRVLDVQHHNQIFGVFVNVEDLRFVSYRDLSNVTVAEELIQLFLKFPLWSSNLKEIYTEGEVTLELLEEWYKVGVRTIESDRFNLDLRLVKHDDLVLKNSIGTFYGTQHLSLVQLCDE